MKRHWMLGFALLTATMECQAALPILTEDTPFASSSVMAPNDGKPHPGVLILHGSEGGSYKNMHNHALVLAASGFSVMTFCWYDCGRDFRSGPVPLLAEVELKNTIKALEWFKKSKFVGPTQKLALYGISRGAEQALILGSLQDKISTPIDAIVVHAPSDIVVGGYSNNWIDGRCWFCAEGDKKCRNNIENWSTACGPVSGSYQDPYKIPAWKWDGVNLKIGQRIEIEKFSNPIMITCGDKDTTWESDRTRRIQATLLKAGRHPTVHIFPNEDHSFTTAAEQIRKSEVDDFLQVAIGKK